MHDEFWTHDIKVFDGVFRYYQGKPRPVRAKIHLSDELNDSSAFEIVPIPSRRGTRTSVMMHLYMFEPILTLTVGLYKKPKHYADLGEAIGETLGELKQEGVRDVQIGNAQAWYYPADRLIVLWECFLWERFRAHPLVEDPHMKNLWHAFEQWLMQQFPEATRIATPFNDPIAESIAEYQTFLRALGYQSLAPEAKAAFGKTLQ